MMTVQTLLKELETQVQDELGSQARVLGMLETQERAIKSGSAEEIVGATAQIEAELKRTAARGKRRQEVLRKLARSWNLSSEALTLSSIIERARAAGLSVNTLTNLRGELRTTMAQVVKRSRRMGALARTNAIILHEAIDTVLKTCDPKASAAGGMLVNAEA